MNTLTNKQTDKQNKTEQIPAKSELVAFMQILGIILVVNIHALQEAVPEDSGWYTWTNYINIMPRMPLFMFLSGFLLKHVQLYKNRTLADERLWGNNGFLTRKTRRLLIPYLIISTIAFFPKTLLSRYALNPVDLSLSDYLHMLVYPRDNVIAFYWFLPTLFFIFMAYAYGSRLLKTATWPAWTPVALTGVLLCLHLYNPLADMDLLNWNEVVHFAFYFATGYCARSYRLSEKINLHPLAGIVLCLAVAAVCNIFGTGYVRKPGWSEVILSLNGILLCLFAGRIYLQHQWTFLNHLAGATYTIYLLSWFPQVASRVIVLKLAGLPWWVASIASFLTGLYLPLWFHHWTQKHRESRCGRVAAWITGQV